MQLEGQNLIQGVAIQSRCSSTFHMVQGSCPDHHHSTGNTLARNCICCSYYQAQVSLKLVIFNSMHISSHNTFAKCLLSCIKYFPSRNLSITCINQTARSLLENQGSYAHVLISHPTLKINAIKWFHHVRGIKTLKFYVYFISNGCLNHEIRLKLQIWARCPCARVLGPRLGVLGAIFKFKCFKFLK